MRLRRRDFLKAAAFAVAAGAAPASTGCARVEDPSIEEGTGAFRPGVASGDPLDDGVVLWTRVTGRGALEVRWEIAGDPAFTEGVAGGTVTTDESRDHTVKIDARGLAPGRTYFYRFHALGETSPVGRTKTAPRDAANLRFAVVSCSSLPHGYFHVYASIAKRPDLDAVVHLGDYIYEYADGEDGDERPSLPEHELRTLDDYRRRYAQYRRDPDLQEAHRQHPWVTTWDDHEVADNAWKEGASAHSPQEGPYAERRRAALRAYEEWMPIRALPEGRIWRALRYGPLADLLMLDTRHWARELQTGDRDPKTTDPARQLLGADQEAWLFEELRTSNARWKLVCQQVLLSPLPQYSSTDQWDGYPAARDRLYDVLERHAVKDVVILSGDIHASFANDLPRRPLEAGAYDPATGKGSLAVEIVAPADGKFTIYRPGTTAPCSKSGLATSFRLENRSPSSVRVMSLASGSAR